MKTLKDYIEDEYNIQRQATWDKLIKALNLSDFNPNNLTSASQDNQLNLLAFSADKFRLKIIVSRSGYRVYDFTEEYELDDILKKIAVWYIKCEGRHNENT